MTSQAKPTSRWGSFLQQAVAGVESRLDTILADEDENQTSTPKPNVSASDKPPKRDSNAAGSSSRTSEDSARTNATNRKPDRLQERLAKAVVSRNTKSENSSTLPSRATSPIKPSSSTRSSFENPQELTSNSIDVSNQEQVLDSHLLLNGDGGPSNQDTPPNDIGNDLDTLQGNDERHLENVAATERPLVNPFQAESREIREEPVKPFNLEHEYEVKLEQMRNNYEIQKQEEINHYLEHIDALQAKLQYLTREIADTAKKTVDEADFGSLNQRLAQRDGKIAQLLEEGQKLSQTEMKHLTTIKKFRAKAVEDEKALSVSRQAMLDAQKVFRTSQDRIKVLEANQKELQDRVKVLQKADKEIDRLSAENHAKSLQITELQDKVAQKGTSELLNKGGNFKELLEAERRLSADLRDSLSEAKVEKQLSEDRLRTQLKDLQGKSDREKERARIVELDLRAELQSLESRVESYRIRTEEVSSKGTDDSQAKLVRQIDTLQNSYAVAGENWRRIESSLLARTSELEKEGDDLGRREGETRRRLREANAKLHRMEDQFEQSSAKTQNLEEALTQSHEKSNDLRNALRKAEERVEQVQQELKTAKESWESRLERLEAEKRDRAVDATPVSSRGHSPAIASNVDRAVPHSRRPQGGPGLGIDMSTSPFAERPVSRRASGQAPIRLPGPSRQESTTSVAQQPNKSSVVETRSNPMDNQDDMFDGVVTPATPERTVNDMFSASTAAAGPSVQLVERMSAAVRRLESEKATSKDELDRLLAQRDEAREQVVTLMREVEEKRSGDAKIQNLEKEVKDVNLKLSTTLEMLGEKSELVEELRADIADMKEIYRSTLENAVR